VALPLPPTPHTAVPSRLRAREPPTNLSKARLENRIRMCQKRRRKFALAVHPQKPGMDRVCQHVCCSALQYVAVCCCLWWQRVAEGCSVVQCVAVEEEQICSRNASAKTWGVAWIQSVL
jgi:hypothetical protein